MLKGLSRRWLINYALILLIILFSYIGNHYQVKTGYQPDQTITRLKPEDITRVGILTADGQLRLQRSSAQWIFEHPFRWPADNINIERLISISNSATDSRIDVGAVDLVNFGLNYPRAVLTLNETPIYFGKTNNIGNRRYLMTDSEVFLLADNYLSFMTRGFHGLIDRRLLPRAMPLTSLQLAGMQLTRSATADWHNKTDTTADTAAFNRLIGNWQTLHASSIKPYNRNSTPLQKITARFNDDDEANFFLLSIKPEIIIARPDLDVQYHFKQKHYYDLLAIAPMSDIQKTTD